MLPWPITWVMSLTRELCCSTTIIINRTHKRSFYTVLRYTITGPCLTVFGEIFNRFSNEIDFHYNIPAHALYKIYTEHKKNLFKERLPNKLMWNSEKRAIYRRQRRWRPSISNIYIWRVLHCNWYICKQRA